jgi:hypothetical protein
MATANGFSLHKDFTQLLKNNKDGSYVTQANRQDILRQSATRIYDLGFKRLAVSSLRTKHINKLIESWQKEKLSAGTIKNRIATLRWVAAKINKANIVARTNDVYGIERRVYINNDINKAHDIHDKLDKITNERVALSLQLQREFGLRREESLKFQPAYADQENRLLLKPSWCKGGRPRDIPIRTDAQRELLNKCHKLVGESSMIPPEKDYKTYLKNFENLCIKVGIRNMHGLRHAYAQDRYKELTGWDCPKNGGKSSKDFNQHEKKIDFDARIKISNELGHGREEVTKVYLGR